jgi:hypothetical protein
MAKLARLHIVLTLVVLVPSAYGDDGVGRRALRFEQAAQANLLAFSPTFATPKCLVPYPICKLAIATVGLVTSWEQILMGGDLEGAKQTLGRGLDGQWLVLPENVTGDWVWSLPGILPLPLYFATGRGNVGPVELDPLPSPDRPQTEGDVLPP